LLWSYDRLDAPAGAVALAPTSLYPNEVKFLYAVPVDVELKVTIPSYDVRSDLETIRSICDRLQDFIRTNTRIHSPSSLIV
jgi:hypothetical protein